MTHGEGSLYALIAAAHAAPEWACLRHVRDGAGWDRRTCDALAMSLWKSRGLVLRGFEIKVSRGDWKREAADPEKAEAVAKFCDEWWLVTPAGLVREPEVELPPTWGLMVSDDSGKALTVARKATRLTPEPISRGFLAQLFKGAQAAQGDLLRGWIPESQIEERIEKARAAGQANGERDARFSVDALRDLRAAVARFRDATGIDVSTDQTAGDWDQRVHGVIDALALGVALRGRYGHDLDTLTKTLTNVRETANAALARLIETIPEVVP